MKIRPRAEKNKSAGQEGDFHIDVMSSTPLFIQLKNRLADWLKTCNRGMRLPAERKLAELAGVSRKTVRQALNLLEKEGKIIVGARGRFVANGANRDNRVLLEIHPLASHTTAVQTLTIASYEILPYQRCFWEQIAKRFSGGHRGIRAVVRLLPREVRDMAAYAEFAHKHRIDLLILSSAMIAEMKQLGALAPLTSEIAAMRQGEADLWRDLTIEHEPLDFYAVPAHLSLPAVIGNRELVKISMPRLASGGEWLSLCLETAKGLPPNAQLFSWPLQLLNYRGTPTPVIIRRSLRDELRQCLEIVRALGQVKTNLVWTPEPPDYHGLDFLEGSQAFHFAPLTYFLTAMGNPPFAWQIGLLLPEDNHRLSLAATAVACSAYAKNMSLAMEFLRFLLTPEAQKIVATLPVNAPVRSDCLSLFAGRLGIEEEPLRKSLAAFRATAPEDVVWEWLWRAEIYPLLLAVFAGKCEIDARLLDEAYAAAEAYLKLCQNREVHCAGSGE